MWTDCPNRQTLPPAEPVTSHHITSHLTSEVSRLLLNHRVGAAVGVVAAEDALAADALAADARDADALGADALCPQR